MAETALPTIVGVDRMKDGIVVAFSDGRYGFYSAALLDAVFPQCQKLDEEDLET